MPYGLKDLNIVAPFMKPSKNSSIQVSCYGLKNLEEISDNQSMAAYRRNTKRWDSVLRRNE